MTYASPFYNLSDSEWKYYITVQGGNPLNILNYTKYFTIVSWYISGKSGDEYPTFTEVEFKPGSNTELKGLISSDQLVFCTNFTDLVLAGDWYSHDIGKLTIQIAEGQTNGAGNVREYMSSTIISLVSRIYFFDYKDINQPIKYNLDFDTYMQLSKATSQNTFIKIVPNEYELIDNYVDTYSPKTGLFYSRGETIHNIIMADEGNHLLGFFVLGLSSNKNEYSRQVYNIFDLVSQLGGIYESVKFFPALLIGIISSKAFFYSEVQEKIKFIDKEKTRQNVFTDSDALKDAMQKNIQRASYMNLKIDPKLGVIGKEIDQYNLKDQIRK